MSKIEWTEQFKGVPGWPGFAVTASGRVRGPSGRERKPTVSRSGHLYLIHRDGGRGGKVRKLWVHHAVLLAHIGPCPPGCEARHLDGDPNNNQAENLAWGSRTENMRDKQRHGTQRRGEQCGTAKLTPEAVSEIRRRIGSMPLRALASEYGVSHTAIRRAANGTNWRHVN